MTPEQHAKAIEDAAVAYAEATHTQDSYGARHGLKAAIIAGVGAVPEGWRLVPVEPTAPMLSKMAECDGYLDGDRDRPGLIRWEDYWRNALAAAPKP